MIRKEALEILEKYQKWRLGKCHDIDYEPKQITEALNFAINHIKPKLKVGSVAKIKSRINGHDFEIGEEISLVEDDTEEFTELWLAENKKGEQWLVSEDEVEII